MAKASRFDSTIFLRVLAGVALGTVVAVVLLLWVIPDAADYRPAVLSTIVVPLGCLAGWLLSPSRERAPTAALLCFGLYFLSAFAAARLGTLFTQWNYFHTIVGVQGLGGLGLAVFLGFAGRALPQVERLRDARDVAGLSALLHQEALPERLEAVRALGSLPGEEARPAILAALDDGDVRVSRAALAALIGLATEADVPRLEVLLQHPDRRIRRRALEVVRWIEGDGARAAVAGYWRHLLAAEWARLLLQALPLILGGILLLVSLAFPWGGAGGSGQQPLPRLGSAGLVVALLLAGSGFLPLVELLWGMGRRNLTGHIERLRIWAFLPLAVLALALLGPLQGATILEAQGWASLGAGFWIALAGVIFELGGAWLFRG